MRRAQSSLEFMILTAAMLVGVLALITVSYTILSQARADQDQASLRAIERAVMNELTHAALTADGYERTFTLPATIEGTEYNIIVYSAEPPPAKDFLIFTWNDITRVVFVEEEISGTIGAGKNTLRRTGTSLTVTNE